MSYELTVSLDGEMITSNVTGLSFKSIDPGGYASVTFDLARPIAANTLTPFSEVAVFDASTGEQVGGGRVLDPGPGVDESGEVWRLSAIGEGPAHMDDIEASYILVDAQLAPWHQTYSTSKKMTWKAGQEPNDGSTDGMLFDIDDGATINATWKCDMRYWPIYDAGQYIGGYSYRHLTGRATGNNRIQDFASTRFSTFDIPNDTSWNAATTYCDAEVGVDFAVSDLRDNVFIRYTRETSSMVAVEADWAHITTLCVMAMRLDRFGQPVVGPGKYNRTHVNAHEAVIDVWARFCPRFDVENADITTSSTFQFTQLAWLNGIKPSGVLEEIMAAEGAYTWHVWEKQPNGKWRAEWVERPTDVRYEITATDGFSSSDGAADLIDRAVVIGKDLTGREIAQVVVGSQPVLDAAGFHRSRVIDLGANIWSDDAAEQIGEQAIADSALASTTATATVARRVLDLYTGRWVKPYHIQPGHLCRVRGVRPTTDTLNPEGESDGSTVFRIVSNTYSADSASSSLELNSYSLTEAKAIADLIRRRVRR